MMKSAALTMIGLFLSFSVLAQNLETIVKAWLDDAPNGFQNSFDKYGRSCGGHCVDIDALYSSFSGSQYKAYFELKPQGSLLQTYNTVKSKMDNWSLLQGWESSSSVYLDHNITYRATKPNGEMWMVGLNIGQNYDGSKPEILSLFISRDGLKSPRVDVPDKETKPLSNNSTVNLKSRLADQKGKEALKRFIAAADNDFEDILLKGSLQKGVYQVKEGHLNPQADQPFITVKDEPQKRILTLRFQIDNPKNHFVFFDLFYEPYNYTSIFSETEWDLDNSDMWKAEHKTKPYLIVRKGYEKGLDVLEIVTVKSAYRKNLAANPSLVSNDCLKGDCVNGFGIMKYTENDIPYRYEGGFRNGKFHGIGYVYRESKNGLALIDLERNRSGSELLLYVGHHKNGKRQGSGLSYAYSQFKDPVRSFRDKSEYFNSEERTGVFNYVYQYYDADTLASESLCSFIYHKGTSESYLSIEQPFTTNYGQCVSGNCQNGTGVLRIKDLGDYKGQFINGQAHGEGILKMPAGEWKRFEVSHGIPKYIRTLKLPEGVSRLPAAKRNVWLLANHDCIEGNCYNGEGMQLRVSADRFRRYNVRYRGCFRSSFRNGVAEGKFRIMPIDDPRITVDGVFKNGVFDGTLIVRWASENTPRYEYYQRGRRVTKDGRDFAEYQEEQRKLWQKEYERKLQAAIAEGAAEAKRRRAEAEALRRKAAAKKAASTTKPGYHRCYTCDGTGSYWNEVVTQDCTVTYDYTYSHGKHYKTSTNCRDVVNGGYIRCPVCGGDGRY